MHYRPLCYFISRIVENIAAAEDIATESFLKLWERHLDFENLAGIKSFLFTTARNAALNWIRQQETHERIHQDIAYLQQEDEDWIRNEEIEAELLRIIYVEIELLPDQCKAVFKSLSFDGLNTSQVAEKFGISPQTVRNQKSKAIQLLRQAVLKSNFPLETMVLVFCIIS